MYKSNCKNCDHNIHIGFCPVAFLKYSMDGDQDNAIYCDCNEYIPTENLEFLEYSYVKRRLKV